MRAAGYDDANIPSDLSRVKRDEGVDEQLAEQGQLF